MSTGSGEHEETRSWIAKTVVASTVVAGIGYGIWCVWTGDADGLRNLAKLGGGVLFVVMTYYFTNRK